MSTVASPAPVRPAREHSEEKISEWANTASHSGLAEPSGPEIETGPEVEVEQWAAASWNRDSDRSEREVDDLRRGACGAMVDPSTRGILHAEMSGYDDDDDDSGDGDGDEFGDVGGAEEDDLDDFDEIDEDDFDDDFDDDFEEELEDEYEIEIEDEISAEFGLGPDKDDDAEELDDLESLADDLDDLDVDDDLKD